MESREQDSTDTNRNQRSFEQRRAWHDNTLDGERETESRQQCGNATNHLRAFPQERSTK